MVSQLGRPEPHKLRLVPAAAKPPLMGGSNDNVAILLEQVPPVAIAEH